MCTRLRFQRQRSHIISSGFSGTGVFSRVFSIWNSKMCTFPDSIFAHVCGSSDSFVIFRRNLQSSKSCFEFSLKYVIFSPSARGPAQVRAARLKWRLDFALAGAWNLAKGGRRVLNAKFFARRNTEISHITDFQPAQDPGCFGWAVSVL